MTGEAKQPVWSYRVLKQQYEGKGGESSALVEYGIVEVYFEKDGEPVGYCDPHVLGDTVDELRRVLAMMRDAIDKPVLETSDFKRKQEPAGLGGPKPIFAPGDSKNRV